MGKAVVGRDVELTIIDRFFEGVRSGSATLLIEGMAGIGKTTVLQSAVERGEEQGARMLLSRPGPSETRLTYAGLLDVLEAVEDDVFAALPAPQRRALDAALLRGRSRRTIGGPAFDRDRVPFGAADALYLDAGRDRGR
jgi:hypothetical protein